MAFSASGLTRLAGGSGVSLWHYTTPDPIADVNTSGYFNAAANMLGLSDVIITLTSTGTTPVLTLAYVQSNNGSVVDITDGAVISNADAD